MSISLIGLSIFALGLLGFACEVKPRIKQFYFKLEVDESVQHLLDLCAFLMVFGFFLLLVGRY